MVPEEFHPRLGRQECADFERQKPFAGDNRGFMSQRGEIIQEDGVLSQGLPRILGADKGVMGLLPVKYACPASSLERRKEKGLLKDKRKGAEKQEKHRRGDLSFGSAHGICQKGGGGHVDSDAGGFKSYNAGFFI